MVEASRYVIIHGNRGKMDGAITIATGKPWRGPTPSGAFLPYPRTGLNQPRGLFHKTPVPLPGRGLYQPPSLLPITILDKGFHFLVPVVSGIIRVATPSGVVRKGMKRMKNPNRTFPTERFGEATIAPSHYANGGLAVQLFCPMENAPQMMEPLARLSIWLPHTTNLPANCFFVKTYSENGLIIGDAAKSGWFVPRLDLTLKFGDLVWELLETQTEGFEYEEV